MGASRPPRRLPVSHPRPVLVVDFGAQYAQLIARRVREARVYSEIVPSTMPVADMLARDPAAIILSGGPSSVYAPGAPAVDADAVRQRRARVRDLLRVPGDGPGPRRRRRSDRAQRVRSDPAGGHRVGDVVRGHPRSAVGLDVARRLRGGRTGGLHGHGLVRRGARSRPSRTPAPGCAGVQFHPEVLHTEHGQAILEHFLHDIAGLAPDWTTASIVDEQVDAIRAQVGDHQVICGLSGGVDSAVAAALVHRAVGDQLTCVFVDHGLLRKGERGAGRARLRGGDRDPAGRRGRCRPVPLRA